MSFNLHQSHYTSIKTTSRNSAKILLPSKSYSNKHCKCKLIVADTMGDVHSFQYVNGLKHTKFTVESPITCIDIGTYQNNEKQRIIVCHNFNISGFTPKGKQIFEHHSNIQGHVDSIFIQSTNIYYTVGCMYQQLTNFKDTEFLLLPDIITSIYNGVLLCELEISSSPVCINRAHKSYPSNYLMYGTSEGYFSLFQVTSENVTRIWEASSKFGTNEILSLEHYDMLNYVDNNSNSNDDDDNENTEDILIVAFTNGRIELYKYDQYKYPLLMYETNVNYHLTSVIAGRFSNVNYPELLCITYTGLIFGLTTQPIRKEISLDQPDPMELQFMSKMDKLNEEISNLENQLQLMKLKQDQIEKQQIHLIPLELIYKFYLNKQLFIYCLNIETQLPIDHILIQSDCQIDLFNIEENTAVNSLSECKKGDGNALLTTYRCQVNTTRFDIQFRTVEGHYGYVSVYVVPKINLSTMVACKCIKLLIHPLSLHCLTHHIEDEPLKRHWNSLQLTGNFSLTEMHNWLSMCLPETPERPTLIKSGTSQAKNNDNQNIEEFAQLFYKSIYLKSQLKCIYAKGYANLQSDNLTTIAILKDVLTKEATRKKIQLTINLDIQMDSAEYMLRMIDTKLIYLKELEEKVKLIKPITELITNEIQSINEINRNHCFLEQITKSENPLPNFLPLEYAQIWRDSDKLKQEFKYQSCQLNRYYECIVSLYIDKYRFQGKDVNYRKNDLLKLLENYNLDKLIEYFNQELSV
uniref:Bardet-Biedl syndrome 7-like protein n=1 Tax=Schistosoma mansoni TaxID=6183 RepID=A0A5K4F8K6_SCHMA